jgi:hypothetical protein
MGLCSIATAFPAKAVENKIAPLTHWLQHRVTTFTSRRQSGHHHVETLEKLISTPLRQAYGYHHGYIGKEPPTPSTS